MSPKYFSTRAFTSSAFTSPATTTTALAGAVVGPEPLLHVLQLGGPEILHRADHAPGVGVVRRVEAGIEEFPHPSVRLVLVLPLLVLDHAALLVESRLGDRAKQVAHAVGLEEQHQIERVHGDVLEVVGAVLVGGAVEVGCPDLLQRPEVILVVVLAPVEHEVLEQVGEAGPARPLVLRPHVVPHVHGDDRRLVVLMDDQRQTIGQHVAGEGDVDGRSGAGLRRLGGQGSKAARGRGDRDREGERGGAWDSKPHGRSCGGGRDCGRDRKGRTGGASRKCHPPRPDAPRSPAVACAPPGTPAARLVPSQ